MRGKDTGPIVFDVPGIGSPPRAGKDSVLSIIAATWCGSPPRAGDRHGHGHDHGHAQRITPACGEQTGSRSRCRTCWQDHPRVRGTDTSFISALAASSGSPPRAGDRPHHADGRVARHRITPAYRGQTHTTSPASFPSSDHPRVRGTDGIICRLPSCADGSSPRAGNRQPIVSGALSIVPDHPACGDTHCERPGADDCSRITPACGGQTPSRSR